MAKESIDILHISDLHFGHGAGHKRSDQKMVTYELVKDARLLADSLGPPDVVLLTGDLAFKGDAVTEYPQAGRWITHLCNELRLTAAHVHMVPGNHDVDRAAATRRHLSRLVHESLRQQPATLDEFLLDSDQLLPIWGKLAAYAEFSSNYGNPLISPEKPFWHRTLHSALGPISLVGLNTCLLSYDNSDANTNLALGKEQIRRAVQEHPADVLMVVLAHHPPTWLADGRELQAWLQQRPHLICTGHIHEQSAVVGMEATGRANLHVMAGAGHGDAEGEHGYAWIRISKRGIALYPRVWSRSRKSFTADRNSYDSISKTGAVQIEESLLPDPFRTWLNKTHGKPDKNLSAEGPQGKDELPDYSFANRVAMLLNLRGYSVEDDRTAVQNGIEFHAAYSAGVRHRTVLVRTLEKSQPLDDPEYEHFKAHVFSLRSGEPSLGALLVTSVGFTKTVESRAERDSIDLISVGKLQTSLIDFRPYAAALSLSLEADHTLKYFVEPNLRRENLDTSENALPALDNWLSRSGINELTLLGDYGTGKTTLLKQYAMRLLQRYRQHLATGERTRLPIFIDLRQYTRAISLKQIILDLLDAHDIRCSYQAFEYVLQEGQVVLLLDGFDEMASRGSLEATLQNFRELIRNATGHAKIVLSCRSHYFHSERQLRRFLGDPAPPEYTDLYREIAGRSNFVLVYLEEFTSEQVSQYLNRRCGDKQERVRDFIRNTYNLEELSRRPVLLDMIVSTEPHVRGVSSSLTPGSLYLRYTDLWLSRNDWQLTTDVDTRAGLLEQFAAKAISEPDAQLNFNEIPVLIRASSLANAEADPHEIDRELRTATFLVRDTEGNYRFSHRSFLEFFYARYLLRATEQNISSPWADAYFRTEVYRFLRDLMPLRSDACRKLVGWILDDRKPDTLRANAAKVVAVVGDADVRNALMHLASLYGESGARSSAISGLVFHSTPETRQFLRKTCSNVAENVQARANAFLALARIADEESSAFLVQALRDGAGFIIGEDSRPLVILLKGIQEQVSPSEALLSACWDFAARQIDSRSISRAAVELCKHVSNRDSIAYCMRVVQESRHPSVIGRAASILPVESRRSVSQRILDILHTQAPSRAIAVPLVSALKGIAEKEVEEALVALIKSNRYGVAVDAFRVLVSTVPVKAASMHRALSGPGHDYELRAVAARAYVAHAPDEAFEHLKELLLTRKPKSRRVALKLQILKLVRQHYPKRLPEIAEKLWREEPAVVVQRRALELLHQVDEQAALGLLLSGSTEANRTGARVSAAAVLGTIRDIRAKKELLRMLRSDPSRYVRLQAVRCLLSPGSMAERGEILTASEDETDPEVLQELEWVRESVDT